MADWTPEEAERIRGVLSRSADFANAKRRNSRLLDAAINGAANLCREVNTTSDADLPTGAKELCAGVLGGLRKEKNNG